jgi:tRNA A-37 threonylcarbamoyl transferase component Bud32
MATPEKGKARPEELARSGAEQHELLTDDADTDAPEGVDLGAAVEELPIGTRIGLPIAHPSVGSGLSPSDKAEAAFADAELPPRPTVTSVVNVSLMGLFEDDARTEGPVDPVLLKTAFAPQAPKPSAPTSLTASSPSMSDSRGGSRRKSSSKRTPTDADLPPGGSIIDKYRLEELVGKGGFAAVYRATHLLLNVPVAIKLLRPKAMKKHAGLAALLCEEARFAAKIDHPNVVRIQDVTHTPAITYIVMEFLEGGTLEQLIRSQGRLPPTRVLQIGLDVVAGLKAGLAQGLIHRDIKPSNILFSKAAVTKIVDLGLAQSSGSSDEPPVTMPGEELPRKFSVVGTPAYMAPEQGIAPGRVDFRADIYALGVTLYHAAVGRPPFPIDKPERCMAMHRSEPVPPPENVMPKFPLPLSKLLLWMLEKSPDGRPESYDALEVAMQEALTDLSA